MLDNEKIMKLYNELKSKLTGIIGVDKFIERSKNVEESFLNPGRLFRDSKDRLFFYIVLFKSIITKDYLHYNLHEGARIIPMIINLAMNISELEKISNHEDKLKIILDENIEDVDAVLFEILVAIAYVKKGYDVTFLQPSPAKKTPDVLAKKKGVEKYIECKKMQRGNDYAYCEIENWYLISYCVAELLKANRIKCHLHFKFTSELYNISPKRIYRKLMQKIKKISISKRGFVVANNKDFKIKFQPIFDSKFDVDVDPLMNPIGPSYIKYLTDNYNPNYGYKVLSFHKNYGIFVSNVNYAAVLSWESTSYKAVDKKAQHVKRHLAEAVRQISGYSDCSIHIMTEECNGSNVYYRRINRNIENIMNFKFNENCALSIYIHLIKYIVPINELFDVEETITTFTNTGDNPESITGCWYFTERYGPGFGSLFEDHISLR